jgi:hypothetical protein
MKLFNILLIIITLFITKAYSDDFESEFASSATATSSFAKSAGIEFNGFLEFEQGAKTSGTGSKDWVMANRRFQLKTTKNYDAGSVQAKLDFLRDDISFDTSIDLRELRIQYTPISWMDLSIGRQVVTWGVGDMLFINDLFPKNWLSNFLGRDMSELKDSSDSLRVTSYLLDTTFDLVYTPQFSPDTTPTGCYLGVYDPNTLTVTDSGTCQSVSNHRQTNYFKNSEFAGSMRRKVGDHEISLYTYYGYYKNPKGISLDPSSGQFSSYYPELTSYGASSEGPLGPGVYSLEFGYYDSREDRKGLDPLIENSSIKTLIGYKMDLTSSFAIGLQWYQETMLKYGEYEQSISGMDAIYGTNNYPYRKKIMHNTFTIRLTYNAMQETLWFNLFTYIRPEDKDTFIKFDVSKRIYNNLVVAVGTNIFTGKDNYLDREFGMLRDYDNVFVRFKYNL